MVYLSYEKFIKNESTSELFSKELMKFAFEDLIELNFIISQNKY